VKKSVLQALASLAIAVAVQVSVPLPHQRVDVGVRADLLAAIVTATLSGDSGYLGAGVTAATVRSDQQVHTSSA